VTERLDVVMGDMGTVTLTVDFSLFDCDEDARGVLFHRG
jgi:hypothetical protein